MNKKFVRMVQDGITPKRLSRYPNRDALRKISSETGWSMTDLLDFASHIGVRISAQGPVPS